MPRSRTPRRTALGSSSSSTREAGSIPRRSVLTVAPLAYGAGALLWSIAATALFGAPTITLLWGCMIVLVCALVSLAVSTATDPDGTLYRRTAASLSASISAIGAGSVLAPVFLAGIVLSGLA
ncbi:hypothetical protein BRD01_09145 [Halobacteriales archaeon QS_8_65_32]|nr:MAG: hypothetical protein BRD01_09145 [Halobacteriales archaeon QS_8_65_32]